MKAYSRSKAPSSRSAGTAPGPLRCTRASAAFLALSASILGACSSTGDGPAEDVPFYPQAPDPPRVQFLRSVSMGEDIEGETSSLDRLLFGEPQKRKGVMAPYGADVQDGVVYICDIQQGVILKMDFTEETLDYVRVGGRAMLEKPANLDFAPDGTMYVADIGRRQIVVIAPDLSYVDEYGPFDDSSRPADVEIVGDTIYVADAGSRCVRALDLATGEERLVIGGPETFTSPTNLSIDSEGNIYVVDTVACQVVVFDAEGEFQGLVGRAGDTVGEFARPKGIAFCDNLLFIVDAAFENCQILDLNGSPIMFFGGTGVGPGNLYLPAGVWIGPEGLELFREEIADDFEAEQLIIITNMFGPRKVNFYALGKSTRFEYPGAAFEPRSVLLARAAADDSEDS